LLLVACGGSSGARTTSADVARVCAGISEREAQGGIAAYRADIERVEPLYEQTLGSRGPNVRLRGATIYLRATPGATAPWIGRLLQCHLLRHERGGSCTTVECALERPGTGAEVSSTPMGFAIAVRASDADSAREVLKRAEALVGGARADAAP
jgi:hypothetical protein